MSIPFPHNCKACLAKGEKHEIKHFLHMRNHYTKHHGGLKKTISEKEKYESMTRLN